MSYYYYYIPKELVPTHLRGIVDPHSDCNTLLHSNIDPLIQMINA